MLRALASITLTGCLVGEPAADGPDPTQGQSVQLTGRTVDYFTGLPIGELGFETLGLAPELTAASNATGAYTLEIPVASSFFVRTAATDNLRPTVSDVARTATADVTVVSRADVVRQHATAGVEVLPNTTAVFVEIAASDGGPLQSLPRTSLSVVDPGSGQTIAAAPFIVGATGDVDPALEVASGQRARFVFLNVAVGAFALVVTCTTCQPVAQSDYPLVSSAGVTVLHATLGGIQGPPPGSFALIYPRFQHGADGGLGCANCHTNNGPSPRFDAQPDEVRNTLITGGYLDVAAPDRSRLLMRPLYETPADHPNATFLSTSDPDYQAIRGWIAAGAH